MERVEKRACVEKYLVAENIIEKNNIYIYIIGYVDQVVQSKQIMVLECNASNPLVDMLPIAGASSIGIAAASKTSPLYSYLLKNTGFGDVWWHVPGHFWF